MQSRVRYLLDLAVAVWVIGCVVLALAVSSNVDGLTHLSDTVTNVGGAVDEAGQALHSLSSLPLIGDRLDQPAQRVSEAGRSVLASGRSSRASVHGLSTLLGWALALIPTVPIVAIYLPFRLGHLRVVRVERRAE